MTTRGAAASDAATLHAGRSRRRQWVPIGVNVPLPSTMLFLNPTTL